MHFKKRLSFKHKMSSRANKSPMRKKANNNNAPAAAVTTAAADYQQEQSYVDLFREIDSDGSGYIDINELFQCVSGMFPDSQITMNSVQDMLNEADTNGDGNISVDEFEVVMRNAQGKNSLWGKTQANLWGRFTRGIEDTIAVAESATAPLKSISRSNSYLDADGMQIASGGLRVIAKSVASFAHIGLMVVASILFVPVVAFIFGFHKELMEILGGKIFDAPDMDVAWTSIKDLIKQVFQLAGLERNAELAFQNDWNALSHKALQDPIENHCYEGFNTADYRKTGIKKFFWYAQQEVKDKNGLITSYEDKGEKECDIMTVGNKVLLPIAYWWLIMCITPLAVNLYTWAKSQDFSQWLFGQFLIGKDGKRLNLTQMAVINSFFIMRQVCLACFYFVLCPSDKEDAFKTRQKWIANALNGFFIFFILSIIDGLPLMFYGKTALEWITGTKCAVK